MKKCFSLRLPRHVDIEKYIKNGWPPFYGIQSWLINTSPLGLISKAAVKDELAQLPMPIAEHIKNYQKNL